MADLKVPKEHLVSPFPSRPGKDKEISTDNLKRVVAGISRAANDVFSRTSSPIEKQASLSTDGKKMSGAPQTSSVVEGIFSARRKIY